MDRGGTERMSDIETAPFRRLEQLIERELDVAANGDLDALDTAVMETEQYMRTLPSPAPAAAQPSVERIKALRSRLTIEVTRLRGEIEHSRNSMRTARKISRTYSQGPDGVYSTTV